VARTRFTASSKKLNSLKLVCGNACVRKLQKLKGRWTTLLIALQRNRKVYCLRSSQIKPKTLG
jgi:hypothetical protein